jgi:hypothetical protein
MKYSLLNNFPAFFKSKARAGGVEMPPGASRGLQEQLWRCMAVQVVIDHETAGQFPSL